VSSQKAATATDDKNDNGLVKGNCSNKGTALGLSVQIRPYRTGDDGALKRYDNSCSWCYNPLALRCILEYENKEGEHKITYRS
jgi:hypothetical protein